MPEDYIFWYNKVKGDETHPTIVSTNDRAIQEIEALDKILPFYISVKLLDWGEEGHRTEAEIASLRAAFTQEVSVWHKLDHPNVTKVLYRACREICGLGQSSQKQVGLL